jgi:tetratricopeptide (TPR) repeat protein
MATTSNLILYRYSPENMPQEILRKLFVGREKILKSMVKEIENSARKKTSRFFLIVGPRGIGKSHFLVLLFHEINNKLGSLLIPIKLREEEYSVYRASDLFLRVLEEKKEDTKEILLLANEDEILHAAIEKLKLISKRDGKRYIIFIENLHELFKQLDLKELQKLRSIFQKYDFFSVVASAPMIFPGISEHDEPFYNFFQIQFLSEFSLEEIKELIQKIAEAEKNKKFLDDFKKYEPKIHGMSHLTGGSPRLVILFYEMIARGELENIENAFFKIIDEHTPYYQEIFQLLTGQKRRIFDAVISSDAPITPKQISEVTRLDLPTVTTQLRRLEQDGYVISRPMGRSTKYEVRERLFRLWREMRQPLGKKRVSILLEFLHYWYTSEERKELFKTKFKMLGAGEKNVLKYLCYITETLPHKFKIEARLKLTPKLIEFGEHEEAAYEIQSLKETAAQFGDKDLEGKIPLHEGNLHFSEKRYEEALEAFKNAVEIFPKDEVFIESTIEICFNFALEELEAGNRGNSIKFMKVVHEISKGLKEDKVAMLTINFLKSAADSGDIQIVKVAVDEIIKLYGNKYEERIKPIIKAIEIVETKDIQKYYNLQIEEREIVGDVVKKITGSDELLPEEIKRKESRLTDFIDI